MQRRTPLRAKAKITRRAPVRRGRLRSVAHADPKLAAIGVQTLVDFPSEAQMMIRSKKTKHARRERAPAEWFAFVRSQPCFVRWLVAMQFDFALCESVLPTLRNLTPCRGPVDADHMGSKMRDGDGEMAHDRTCVSVCHGHHMERHDFAGTFKEFAQDDMRAFLARGIAWMHDRAREFGIAIPDC